jgi:hypothetical protein
MDTQYSVLSISHVQRRGMGSVPAMTVLAGAAVFQASYVNELWSFELETHSTLSTDEPGDTLAWLTERPWNPAAPLLLWRAGDIVLPALIAAAEDCPKADLGLRALLGVERLLTGTLVDVADLYGGAAATSFDAVAHANGVSFLPLTKTELNNAWHSGNHGLVRQHLAARAAATLRLWLMKQNDQTELASALAAWSSRETR